MHPIEILRHLARSEGADPGLVATEAASALGEIASVEPAGLVPACRRLVEAHVVSGPVWWLSARVLGADDQAAAARQASRELAADLTARHLAAELPDDTTALVVGWPDIAAAALRSRGDVEALVVESCGEGSSLVRRLRDRDGTASLVAETGVGPAAAVADIVIVEADAAGPSGLLAAPLSLAAAAVAAHSGAPVWAVTGVGRVLPDALWQALLARVDDSGREPWDRDAELVPAGLVSGVIGPDGPAETDTGLAAATCPVAPELLRPAG
jgi:hypothetical protein